MLLHDNNYLQDKSVKKVSVATLKRRQNMLNQTTIVPEKEKEKKNSYNDVKSKTNL